MDQFDVAHIDDWQDEHGEIDISRATWADNDGAGALVWLRGPHGDLEVATEDVPRLVDALQAAAQGRALSRTLTA